MNSKVVHSALFGLAIGDALGVPVEFQSRETLKRFPVTNMREYGSHGQPAGTWSDDSSLTFCLAESLCNDYDLNEIAQYFLLWSQGDFWTPYGKVFDIGIATQKAMLRVLKGELPTLCGGFDIQDNGNGSLMRILPLAFYLKNENDIKVVFQKVKEVSSITHAHFRSVFSCFVYIVYALELIKGVDKLQAYRQTKNALEEFTASNDFNKTEIDLFKRVLKDDIQELKEDQVYSSGYVLHSLEASLWCVLNSNSYEETVLKAVNLGEDTDTTSAIAGGLAGIIYGYESIPKEWLKILARKNSIEDLCTKLSIKYEL